MEKPETEKEAATARTECDDLFSEFVRKHHLAVEDLTERQLAEAIRQAIPDFRRNIHADKQSVIYLPGSEADRWKNLYHKLLMAVESKHDGESRHETALRYIRERENRSELSPENVRGDLQSPDQKS